VVTEGGFEVTGPDQVQVLARAGDTVVLPRESGHLLGSPGAGAVSAGASLARHLDQSHLTLDLPGDSPAGETISASFRF
jgi:hypothetical protein